VSTTETTFEALGLPEPLLQALKRAGYTAPTPIQAETIPPLLEGRDVLGQAATGTGKTAAFALPILSQLTPGASKPFETGALVLVPTRELALQVTESMKKYSDAMGISVLAIYGGQEFTVQLRPLKRGVDVVVATPGRAIDHLKRKTLKLDRVRTVVLDEADEMLDMGFAEDLEVLLSALPTERQVALFSATMPSRILKIAERQMKNPVRVSIARALSHGEGQKVRQVAYVVPRRGKVEALLRVLELEQPSSALVFCRTRADVDELASVLDEKGLATEALHGGLSQDQRDRVMKKFKSGVVKYVVATDVAARGIHVDNLSHVINADVPTSPEVYVHRIGRTGRAGREGVAITFAEPGEVRLIKGLERAAGGRIQQLGVPSADQVKSKKLKATQNAVAAAMEAGRGTHVRAWVDSLGDTLPAMAAAAIELLHQAMHNEAPEAPVQSATQALEGTRHEAPPRSRPSASRSDRPARAHELERASPRQEPEARGPRPSAGPSPRAHHDPKPPRASAGHGARGHEAEPKAPRASAGHGARGHEAEPKAPRASAGHGARAHEAEPKAPRASAGHEARGRDEAAKVPRASAGRSSRAEATSPRARSHDAESKPPRTGADRPSRPGTRDERAGGAQRFDPKAPRGATRFDKAEPRSHQERQTEERQARKDAGPSRGKPGDVVTLWVGAGSQAGIRPGDLVGAIANEAGLHSKQIGPIEIREGYSLVGVPTVTVEAVIDALENSGLRGRKVKVRREKN